MDNNHLRTGPPRIGDQRAEYADLIERLEKATGPDGELDAYLWLLADRPTASRAFWNAAPGLPKPIPDVLPHGLGRNAVIANAPRYTASIDAALTLVPSGAEFEVGSAYLVGVFWASVITQRARYIAKGARTPAIALCIAALKGRST